MRGYFAVLSWNKDIYFDEMYTWVCYISLNSQKKKLSELMSHVKIRKVVTKWECQEMENWLFKFYFLIWDIFLNICFPIIKFHTLIENIQMEGTVSQIFYLGPSFDFMLSRKIIMQK